MLRQHHYAAEDARNPVKRLSSPFGFGDSWRAKFQPLKTSTPYAGPSKYQGCVKGDVLLFAVATLLLAAVGLCYNQWLTLAGLGMTLLMAWLVGRHLAAFYRRSFNDFDHVDWATAEEGMTQTESMLIISYSLLALSFLLIEKQMFALNKLHGFLFFTGVVLMTGPAVRDYFERKREQQMRNKIVESN